jgi:hypothetical protein
MTIKFFEDKGNAMAFVHKARREGYATAVTYYPKDGLWMATINHRRR